MDNTQSNKSIDASATRKRRSSILKSQRPPRTPFSELEFKVATPTDTAKSRRVSFSRLTGVAEFVTNEATTTWKTFYEEHNKSLESSGNDSAAKAQKCATIGHLGRSIFEQQFEEVEVVDLGGTIVPSNSRQDFQTSSNANFTQQIADLERTEDDGRLTLPQQNFELSALTDHQSKLFGDDLTVPGMTDMSNQIKINFSNMQTLDGKCDDLDEIQNDLKRAQQNVICPGPVFSGNISEYIEVDLNMTHVALKSDDCDMSITDTVCSPKVQEVSKKSTHKKSITDFNLEDKENVVVNPYAPIREKDNFAVNEELDKVLVFDGKRLTVQTEKKSKLHSAPQIQPRKTIVLNTDDDLPNFIAPTVQKLDQAEIKEVEVEVPRRKTIVFEDEQCDISVTQAVPAKVIVNEKRRTIVYENDAGDISMTQAMPTNIIYNDEDVKQKTIVYEDDNISFTQVLPANVVQSKQDKTLHFQNNDVSITEAIPQNIIQNKRRTICTEVDVSMTQAVPTNILTDKENAGRTILYDNDMEVSMTQAVPQNILLPQTNVDKQKTIVYDNDNCDISMTEALPAKAILPILENVLVSACDGVKIKDASFAGKLGNQTIKPESQDISMTQALPSNILLEDVKSKSILYADENMSTTRVMPDGIIIENYENGISENIKENTKLEEALHKSINKELSDNNDMSVEESKVDTGNLSLKNPIPSVMATLNVSLDKTLDENKELFKMEKSEVCEKQEILVYQAIEHVPNITSVDKDFIETKPMLEIKDTESDASVNKDVKNIETNKSVANIADSCDVKEENVVIEQEVKEEKADLDEDCKVKSDTTSVSLIAKKSILNELLDMSTASSDPGVDDKDVTADIETPPIVEEIVKSDDAESRDSLFIIRKASNEDAQALINETLEETKDVVKIPLIENKIPAIEYKEEENAVEDINDKIDALKKAAKQNRHYEQVVSSDVNCEDKIQKDVNASKAGKSFKNADDTRELLQMLSEFTDRRSLTPILDEPETEVEKEVKTQNDTKRISFAPTSRPTLSKEDIFNNISMAQAALQQSIDGDSDSVLDTDDSPNEIVEIERSGRKSLRISGDVVKALQFDESASDSNVEEVSPLKKTAFGETSYMTEAKVEKAKVIPTYDVSDGVKELMHDLVKPMTDVLPFESGDLDRSTKKSPSTISTQIQANLITSSQIDLDVELQSNPESTIDVKRDTSLMGEIARLGSRAVSAILKQTSPTEKMDVSVEEIKDTEAQRSPARNQTVPGQVIVFDHSNPLNNVVLSPMDYEDAHPYNPIKSNDNLVREKRSVQFSDTSSQNKVEVERVSTQYNVDVQNLPAGDACAEKTETIRKSISNVSKPMSMDRSTEGFVKELKDTDINTEIAMKKNRELLEANSSLTLVDDALVRNEFDVDINSRSQSESEVSMRKSPLRVIYKMDRNGVLSEKIDSDVIDLTSNDDFYEDIHTGKSRKRSYSPTRQDACKPNTDVTPKPVHKMQRISNSPEAKVADKDHASDQRKNIPEKKSPKKLKSPKCKKPSVTIQQLLTEYNIVDVDRKTISEEVDHALKGVVSGDAEFRECLQAVTSYSDDMATEGTDSGPDSKGGDWQRDSLSERSSRNVMDECVSSAANVVAKINMLPFMGRDCEWESSAGDSWSFLVLRGRVRLSARLAHSYQNAPRSRVRADTPVLSASVEPVHDDEKDPLVSLCVRLACESMRCEWSRACVTAGAVPAALRRCVGVARLALRWVRALKDAAARTALDVRADGRLTLKVANVPLRSVWELTLQVELVVEDAQQLAWPRAAVTSLVAIVADELVPVETLARVADSVPHDWGHVPRTIWKLFKYLKNKMRDEDLCGLTILNALRCK